MTEMIKNIIAERELTFRHENGTEYKCRLVFGIPYNDPDLGIASPYQILGYGDERIRSGHGVDTLQAFLIAVEKANVELAYTFPEGKFLFDGQPELFLEARDLRQ